MTQVKILLVEDDKLISLLLSTALSASGYSVDVAPDGANALNLLKNTLYDIVITDIQMPVMDGFELLSSIRTTDSLKALPVIALSGMSPHTIYETTSEFDDILGKPIDNARLLQVLKEHTKSIKGSGSNQLSAAAPSEVSNCEEASFACVG